jgi:hypothetical protein
MGAVGDNPPIIPHLDDGRVLSMDNLGSVVKTIMTPSPSHHHFYRWYGYHSQLWVVYDFWPMQPNDIIMGLAGSVISGWFPGCAVIKRASWYLYHGMSTLISLMRALVLRYILIVILQMPWKKWRNNIYNDFHQNTVESRNNVIVNPPKAHTHMLFEVNSKLKEDPAGSKKTVKQ